MTLIRCLECKNDVSSNADFCPKCGNKDFYDQWFNDASLKIEAAKRLEKENRLKKVELNKDAKAKGFKNHDEMMVKMKNQKLEKDKLEAIGNNKKKWNKYIFWLVIILLLSLLFQFLKTT